MEYNLDEKISNDVEILVIGAGGAGNNTINRMIEEGLKGVKFIAMNTDAQVLRFSKADDIIQLGPNLTRGLGAGSNPQVGRDAAIESLDIIDDVIGNPDLVFISSGMGGGTGTGAISVIASRAKLKGALVVGVVTLPFKFEGGKRSKYADRYIEELEKIVDTLIVIPNDKLLNIVDKTISVNDAFKKADETLYNAINGMSSLITESGLINLDFADVKHVMENRGHSLLGIGYSDHEVQEEKVKIATQNALYSPLIEGSIVGADSVLLNIEGGKDLTLYDAQEASTIIQEAAGSDVNIILGTSINSSLEDEIRVTVIATGKKREIDNLNYVIPKIVKENDDLNDERSEEFEEKTKEESKENSSYLGW